MWQSAVDEELASMKSKNTWTPDDSRHAQPLPTHIIFKVNASQMGERFKSRVVAGGNFQTYGEDYPETYAPVV